MGLTKWIAKIDGRIFGFKRPLIEYGKLDVAIEEAIRRGEAKTADEAVSLLIDVVMAEEYDLSFGFVPCYNYIVKSGNKSLQTKLALYCKNRKYYIKYLKLKELLGESVPQEDIREIARYAYNCENFKLAVKMFLSLKDSVKSRDSLEMWKKLESRTLYGHFPPFEIEEAVQKLEAGT